MLIFSGVCLSDGKSINVLAYQQVTEASVGYPIELVLLCRTGKLAESHRFYKEELKPGVYLSLLTHLALGNGKSMLQSYIYQVYDTIALREAVVGVDTQFMVKIRHLKHLPPPPKPPDTKEPTFEEFDFTKPLFITDGRYTPDLSEAEVDES